MGDGGGAHHAARAGPVLDHDALPECVAEMLGQDAADHVGAAAGWPRHDDAHGFARPSRPGRLCRWLRTGDLREGGTGKRADHRNRG